jgi:RHS repeat-associated protein
VDRDVGRGERRTQFWYDGDRLAAEQDPDGRVRVYVYAAEDSLVPLVFVDYDGIDADPQDGRVHTVFVDHLGMPLLIENHRGLPVWRAAKVDPYGAIEVDPTSSIHYALRWPGHYFDRDTGLHYNRHRYYDPVLGRYLQSDPLGIAGGDNLYAYASNPLVHVDLLGLHAKPDKPAKPKDGKSPSVEDVKRGEVGSYKDLKSRAKVGDKLEHDHIPSFAAVRDEMARQKKRKLTPGEEAALRDNLTAAEVDADVHRAGRTHGSKNRDPVKRAEDGADLKSAAQKDMDAHRDNLKEKGMTDEEIDAMEEQIHKRNQEKGVYDKPLPDSLLK